MASRREFMTGAAAAGVGFLGCDLAAPPARGAAHGPVTINGKRITTIDIHAHSYVHDVWPLIKGTPGEAMLKGIVSGPLGDRLSSVTERLAEMDREGIDIQAVSLHAGQYHHWAERDLAAEIVRIQNEKLAEVVAGHPDRFVGLGAVALQHPELAARQLEDGIRRLGLRGFMITASIDGEEISAPRFAPFWKKAEETGTLIFIHPRGFEAGESRLKGPGRLDNTIGNPLETTVALSHMIFGGFLDRHPGIKIVAAHGGGYLPGYIGRSDKCHSWDKRCQGMKKKPSAYLRDLYFDSLVYSSRDLAHLINEVGAERIVIGTDFPFGMAERAPLERIMGLDGLSDEARIAMLGGTAARLLGIGPDILKRRGSDRGNR